MALRRRQTSFMEEKTYPSSSSLAAQALMIHSSPKDHHYKGGPTYDYTSMEGSNDAGTFWGVLARKAKAIIDEDSTVPYQSEYLTPTRPETVRQVHDQNHKIQIRRNGNNEGASPMQNHTSKEDLIKASRDVAMATAAKAKQLLRELKTVKADLAFAQQRCSQLEEENKVLREGREKGVFPGDDDMIRLQLETLLAEKARLAHENSVYDSENRFLREIVEYHQLTMQDVVYLDEGIEEVTEVYDYPTQSERVLSASPPSSLASRRNSISSSLSRVSSVAKEMLSLSATAH